MSERHDVDKHGDLVAELLDIFKQQGFEILGVSESGLGYPRTTPLYNDGYGDQEDKAPDIYAYDGKRKAYIIGEAKTGAGDFETEHALTQYNVYTDQTHQRGGGKIYLYVIVPASKVPEFNSLITHYIHREYWGNLLLVSSKRWQE
ncbi:MAG: hypothetical protein L0Y80_01540 [Ignavibacteriae bacterium]|nr:hypothetical protein [Ignavibacteriota bacterium]